MAKIELFSARVCPFAQRSRIALMEKGVKVQLIEIDLGNKPDWFSRISPYGKVPVLKHGEIRVYESAIINEYLEETFPAPPLMPEPPDLRAQVRMWIDYCNTQYIPDFYKLLLTQEQDERDRLREKLIGHLKFIEHEGFAGLSGKGPYWLGSRFSLLDIAWYPFFERFVVAEHYRQVSIPAACRRLQAWIQTMTERPSAKATANSRDYYIKRYARYADGTANGITAREMRSGPS